MRYPKSTAYALFSVRRKRPAPARSTRATRPAAHSAARIRAARAPVATVASLRAQCRHGVASAYLKRRGEAEPAPIDSPGAAASPGVLEMSSKRAAS